MIVHLDNDFSVGYIDDYDVGGNCSGYDSDDKVIL